MKFKLQLDSLLELAAESIAPDTVHKAERLGEAALGALLEAGLPVSELARLIAGARCPDGEIDPVDLLNRVKGSAELEAWAKKWASRFRSQKKRPPIGLVREMVRDAVKSRFH